MHSLKFGLYSLSGGGVEETEEIITALHREVMEETGCSCDKVEELGMVYENRASLDYNAKRRERRRLRLLCTSYISSKLYFLSQFFGQELR